MTPAPDELVVGSRGSALAMVQAEWVRERLVAAHPGLEVRIEEIDTTGDKILDTPLAKIGDKGLFTKELEQALGDGRIDLAVHSAKDMPTMLPDGLEIAAFTVREDVRDAFVGRADVVVKAVTGLPAGARIGSSSLRRRSQLLALQPDLELVDLRGNVGTRLRKIGELGLDGTVLAAAGLHRLGRDDAVSFAFGFDEMLPAVGQGSLAIEVRGGDERVHALVAALDDGDAAVAVRAERALMRRLEGGCQVPIAAHATLDHRDGAGVTLVAYVGSIDGRHTVRDALRGAPAAPEALGEALAERLLAAGADAILAGVRGG